MGIKGQGGGFLSNNRNRLFFAFNTLKFLEKGDRLIKPINIIETSQISSYEIDSPFFDWEIMET